MCYLRRREKQGIPERNKLFFLVFWNDDNLIPEKLFAYLFCFQLYSIVWIYLSKSVVSYTIFSTKGSICSERLFGNCALASVGKWNACYVSVRKEVEKGHMVYLLRRKENLCSWCRQQKEHQWQELVTLWKPAVIMLSKE